MRTGKSLARAFFASSLLGIFSCACSATSPNDAYIATEADNHGKAAALDGDTSSDSCEGKSQACKQMQMATMKMHKLESEIINISAEAYGEYLADDPEYVKDIENYLRESGRAWRSYRDAECLLEPYINGMSRREIGSIAEQCKLERTERRIFELEGLLTTVKSNRRQ